MELRKRSMRAFGLSLALYAFAATRDATAQESVTFKYAWPTDLKTELYCSAWRFRPDASLDSAPGLKLTCILHSTAIDDGLLLGFTNIETQVAAHCRY